jgi:hypothetical protein
MYFQQWLHNNVVAGDDEESGGRAVDIAELHGLYLRHLVALIGGEHERHPVARHTLAYELRRNHYGKRGTRSWRLKLPPAPRIEAQFDQVCASASHLEWVANVLL